MKLTTTSQLLAAENASFYLGANLIFTSLPIRWDVLKMVIIMSGDTAPSNPLPLRPRLNLINNNNCNLLRGIIPISQLSNRMDTW